MTTATDQQLAAQMMVQAKEGNIQDKGNGGAIVDSTIDHHRWDISTDCMIMEMEMAIEREGDLMMVARRDSRSRIEDNQTAKWVIGHPQIRYGTNHISEDLADLKVGLTREVPNRINNKMDKEFLKILPFVIRFGT